MERGFCGFDRVSQIFKSFYPRYNTALNREGFSTLQNNREQPLISAKNARKNAND